MQRALYVDVCIDLICPWCWIGKRGLDQALARFRELDPDVDVQVRWHSIQLIPDVPPGGWPYAEFYERRLGSPEAVQARQAQVRDAAAKVGLSLHFDRIATFPNTAPAHRLLGYASQQLSADRLSQLIERLYEAYFVRGERLDDAGKLAQIAAEFGVNTSGAAPGPDPWSEPGLVSGVPLFVFNQRRAVSGAQPADALLAALRQSTVSPDAVAS